MCKIFDEISFRRGDYEILTSATKEMMLLSSVPIGGKIKAMIG